MIGETGLAHPTPSDYHELLACGIATLMVGVFVFSYAFGLEIPPNTSGQVVEAVAAPIAEEKRSTEVAPTPEPIPEARDRRSERYVSYQPDPMRRWTQSSDGNTWAYASEEEKNALADRLSNASGGSNSATFFREALDTFYSDPKMRNNSMETMTRLIDTAGRTLPEHRRKY